jgi:hypothetical protein
MKFPCTDLYRHVRRREYIMLSWCVSKQHGMTTAWGKLVPLSEEDIRERGLQMVLRDLEGFSKRESDVGAEINGKTPEAKRARKRLRECWQVIITLRPNSVLEFQPMQDIGKDRGVGNAEDRLTIQLPSSPQEFFRVLNEAFDKCCVIEGY